MSARSAVGDAIARIESDTSGAVVTLSPHALDDAERVDGMDGDGALHGVPFTVKDVIATTGLRTTAACQALADHVPASDAPAVARMRVAGAVLVGKTNCSELALSAWTGNPLFPETRNPHRDGCSPGGSSGGCAAAVAAGLVPISLGTDYGGSIRFPAACCGVVGLRPTPGRIPSDGQLPTPDPNSPRGRFSLIGPLARAARDLRAAFEALADEVRPAEPARRAIALADAAAHPAMRHAAQALADLGVGVRQASMPWLRGAADTFSAVRNLDTYDDLRPIAEQLGPALQRLIAAAPTSTDPAARRDLDDKGAKLLEQALVDLHDGAILVLPIADDPIPPAAGRAPDLETLWPARAITLLGLPAVAIGGIQLVGAPDDDEAVLATAILLEPLLDTRDDRA